MNQTETFNSMNEDQSNTAARTVSDKTRAQHKADCDRVMKAVRNEKKRIQTEAATDPYSFLKPREKGQPIIITSQQWIEEFQDALEDFMASVQSLKEKAKYLGTNQEEAKAKADFTLSTAKKTLDSLQALEPKPINTEGAVSDTRQAAADQHPAQQSHAGRLP